MSKRVISLASMTEEEKLTLALDLMSEPVNQLDARDIWEEYVDSAGPHGLPEQDLDDLLEWLAFGTDIIILMS